MKNQNRICIYPKDIARITGRTERYARKVLDKIKERYSKTEDQYISIDEFCQFTGLKIEQVQPFLVD
ncbi:MAG TPA: hypothetical protein VF868_05490 [Bacteroidia bacterium]|jgi:hypothetical protein